MAPRRETTHIAGVCPPLPPPDSPSSGLSQILLWSKAPKGCGLQAPRKGADNQRGNDPSYPSGVLIGLGLRVSSARHTPSEPWTPPPAAPWKGPGGSSRSQEEGSQTLEIPTLSRPGPSPGLEFPHLRGSLCPSMAPGSPEKAQGFNWLKPGNWGLIVSPRLPTGFHWDPERKRMSVKMAQYLRTIQSSCLAITIFPSPFLGSCWNMLDSGVGKKLCY